MTDPWISQAGNRASERTRRALPVVAVALLVAWPLVGDWLPEWAQALMLAAPVITVMHAVHLSRQVNRDNNPGGTT